MVLKDLTDEKLIRLSTEAADWEGAIHKSAQPLIDGRKIKPPYVDDITTRIRENGPCVVLTKHVTLPYARPESGVLESAIGITTLKTSAISGNEINGPVEYLFCLSTKDNMGYLNILAKPAGMFEGTQFYRFLEQTGNVKEIMEYVSKQKKEETDMCRTLVCCRAGMESSMLLKAKTDQVISENGYPIQTEHGDLGSLSGFSGDLVTTVDDLADELKDKVPYALGIHDITDKVEMKSKMEEFLTTRQG